MIEYSDGLYEQGIGIIHSLAKNLLKNDKEDILELQDLIAVGKEAFLKALKTYDDTKGASFITYLHIKVRSAMKDEIRKNSLFRRVSPKVASKVFSSPDPSLETDNPEEVILVREKLRLLKGKLRKLPPEHKRIIKLMYWNGMNMVEVSSYLNISEGRVSQLHKEAINYLRDTNEGEDNKSIE
jgi:RNA polymerase sigma factor (sigma-70 family)